MHVETEKRDFIDYEGYIVIPKLKPKSVVRPNSL